MMCSAPGPVPDGLDGRSQIDSAVLVPEMRMKIAF